MKAAVLRGHVIVVDDVPEPVPGAGQVLVETIACGICGSDLHCRLHGRDLVAASREAGLSVFDFDPDRDLVMGHEFSARVLDAGPGVSGPAPGTEVVAFPVVQTAAGPRAVGYSNDHPGGFGPRLVVDAAGVRPIPEGLDPRLAALTEPAAVGLHAVNRSILGAGSDTAIVLGCGPVGLMTIAALRMKGVPLVVAADLSLARRAMALRIGADVVVDPREEPPVEAWAGAGGEGRPVLFEAVGVPGMIDTAMRAAPAGSQVVVVGLCMQPDHFSPALGISKRLTLTFVLGWTPAEFDASLAGIADGTLDVAPLVTDEVGIDGVADAFDRLADPADQVKILVSPNGAV
jgi:2-desacetyl-2-hydroxyethyl bacteriochlorophyllide A dehydrogenase